MLTLACSILTFGGFIINFVGLSLPLRVLFLRVGVGLLRLDVCPYVWGLYPYV